LSYKLSHSLCQLCYFEQCVSDPSSRHNHYHITYSTGSVGTSSSSHLLRNPSVPHPTRLEICHLPSPLGGESSPSCARGLRLRIRIVGLIRRVVRVIPDTGTGTTGVGLHSDSIPHLTMASSSTLSPRFSDDGSFPSFPRLPTEIRVKIWSHSLPVRILPIKAFSPLGSSSNDDSFLCTEPPPVLLSVCREARYEALRFYVLISDTRKPSFPHESSSTGPGARFYFNPYLDTIFLDASRPVQWLRILRTIESHSRILSLALRNAHQCPHTFAIEVSDRCPFAAAPRSSRSLDIFLSRYLASSVLCLRD
jgi:hypothetical protein